MAKKRKYNNDYISYGFTFTTERDGTENPQCFLCGKVLANSSMKPAKLKEHLSTIHPRNVSDSPQAFRNKKARFEKSGTLVKHGFVPTQKPLVEASYKVAYRIAKEKKPHTIAETLIKPCALEMIELVCGSEQRKKIEAIPMSNNVIKSRIADIAENILKQVMEELAASPFAFSMQLDESTDVSQCSQLLVFVRYAHGEKIKEEFLFCEPLLETTKAIDVFRMVKEFFEKQNFDWKKKLGSICTDGAPAMLGNKSGFAALVKNEVPHVVVTHCFLHRYALAAKTLPASLKDVLSICVKIVNFIRSRAVNHRIFKALCQELGSDNEVLLYHSEVRWLSRGEVLKRMQELKHEVSIFLKNKGSPFSEKFDCKSFSYGMAYLADIFGHINNVNRAIQGPGVTIFDATEKLKAFLGKLPLWKRRMEAGNYANFPMLEDLFLTNETQRECELFLSMREQFCAHLDTLQISFKGYFNMDNLLKEGETWIRNPFLVDLNSICDEDLNKDDLIDLRANELLRIEFNSKTGEQFWCSQRQTYPSLAKQACNALIPFVTTYLCEAGFSALVTIKTKHRNRLDVKDDMRAALSKTQPQFSLLVQEKQQQPSH